MIYLDAAATTLEKPPQVRQAMAQAAAELSTPGRLLLLKKQNKNVTLGE